MADGSPKVHQKKVTVKTDQKVDVAKATEVTDQPPPPPHHSAQLPPGAGDTMDDATNKVIQSIDANRRRFSAASGSGVTEFLGQRISNATPPAELTPVPIVPTVYPRHPGGAVIVQNHITTLGSTAPCPGLAGTIRGRRPK